jgi:hypothetical protein
MNTQNLLGGYIIRSGSHDAMFMIMDGDKRLEA